MRANEDQERRWSPSPGAEMWPLVPASKARPLRLNLSISQLLQQTRGLELPSRAGDSPAARLPQNCGRNPIIPPHKLRIFIPNTVGKKTPENRREKSKCPQAQGLQTCTLGLTFQQGLFDFI